ncbi:hypothetical protein [Streptomyces axinellae]|uniref:Lipoprotein n=1 Tax=Streptomyces axinellae TaxID=552788 RepID=A0ABP6C571_9ACTN
MPRRCLPAPAMALAVALVLGTAACDRGTEGRAEGSVSGQGARERGTPHAGGRPQARGAVTVARAERLLDRYERLVNKANKARNIALLAQAEAGNALERSRAGYEQYQALSRRERAAATRPFSYRNRIFHIPAGADWFLVTATRTPREPPGAPEASTASRRPAGVLLFANRNGHWRLRAALELQAGRLPRLAEDAEGLARTVSTAATSGELSAEDIPAAYEDLWQTGGKDEAATLAPNPVTREARSTYRDRDDALGAQGAHKRFIPRAPRYGDSYALRTADGGVLALVPLAHEQRLRVTRPGLQLTPSAEEAVYDAAPRTVIVTTFHGQALVRLPPRGAPVMLAAKYALVGSR